MAVYGREGRRTQIIFLQYILVISIAKTYATRFYLENRFIVSNRLSVVFSASENHVRRAYFCIDAMGKWPTPDGMQSELIKRRFVMNYYYDIPVVSRLHCTHLRANANEIYDFNCGIVWLIKRNRTWLKCWSRFRRGDRQNINNNRRLICMYCVKQKSR